MERKDLLKVLVLLLIPINSWLIVIYWYPKHLWLKMRQEGERREELVRAVELEYMRKTRFKIEEGKTFPLLRFYPFKVIGPKPPLGLGVPVLFIYIAWAAEPEIWEPAVFEALRTHPELHVVLLYDEGEPSAAGLTRDQLASKMWQKWSNNRVSIVISPIWYKAFGDMRSGILAVLCDGQGVIRHIEPYPELKYSPFWHEEVADWRPKLHQAVKRALEKFFGRSTGQSL